MHHKDPLNARKSTVAVSFNKVHIIDFLKLHRVIAFMVLSIIASLLAIPLIVFSGIGIGELHWDDDNERKSKFLLSKFNTFCN